MAQFHNQSIENMGEDYYDVTDYDHSPIEFEDIGSQKDADDDKSLDSDYEDDFELVNNQRSDDTSALEARNGKDIQGIPWERLNFTRDKYRESRLKQYRNYENLSVSREGIEKEYKQVEKGHCFYDFQFNTRMVKSTIVHFQIYTFAKFGTHINKISRPVFGRCSHVTKQHTIYNAKLWMRKDCESEYELFCRDLERYFFAKKSTLRRHIIFSLFLSSDYAILVVCGGAISSFFSAERLAGQGYLSIWYDGDIYDHYSGLLKFLLRNLLWATSKNDVYLMQNQSVMHWSSILRGSKEVVDAAKPIVSAVKYPGSYGQTLPRVQISSMSIKDNLLVAGGFQGEFICKYLDKPGVAFSTKIIAGENAITNSVDICNINGSLKIMTANNDAQVRVFDAGNFVCLNRFSFPWSVNNTSVSPDGKSLAVLGDSAEFLIADAQSGKVIGNLKGHLDYSFASAWHPDGWILATGNQDTTCRLWDIRNTSKSVSVLKGRMGAIRAIRFTSDGRFMAMAEPADFVHILDTQCDYAKVQEIDLFGEIAGISFSPDTEALFVGIADRTYGSLLEFNKRHCNHYLDCVF